jgi:hypothetical protein
MKVANFFWINAALARDVIVTRTPTGVEIGERDRLEALRDDGSDPLVKFQHLLVWNSHFNLLIISINDKFRRLAPQLEV